MGVWDLIRKLVIWDVWVVEGVKVGGHIGNSSVGPGPGSLLPDRVELNTSHSSTRD